MGQSLGDLCTALPVDDKEKSTNMTMDNAVRLPLSLRPLGM